VPPIPTTAPFWPSTYWPSDRLSLLADLGSFAGLAASVWAAIAASKSINAVRRLEGRYRRRDLLPEEVARYQEAFISLVPVLSNPPNSYAVSKSVGELKGRLNALQSYLRPEEMRTLKSVRDRITLIESEPKAPNHDHLQVLVSDASTLSAELDTIVGNVNWNNPS
jgi:hypothetical protein